MELKNLKNGAYIVIGLKSGVKVSGVLTGKSFNTYRHNKAEIVYKLGPSENTTIEVPEKDIDSIHYYNEEDGQYITYCNFEKYGIDSEMSLNELINFFIYTWNDYSDSEKDELSCKLLNLMDAKTFCRFLGLVSESSDQLRKYHQKCKRQLTKGFEKLVSDLNNDFNAWESIPLLELESEVAHE